MEISKKCKHDGTINPSNILKLHIALTYPLEQDSKPNAAFSEWYAHSAASPVEVLDGSVDRVQD